MEFVWQIPNIVENEENLQINLRTGTTVFIVGANGSGKSALITHLVKNFPNEKILRIAAHRQSWFHSSSVDLTPKTRKTVQNQILSRDRQDASRWKDDIAEPRSQVAIFDLANAQNRLSRDVFELMKSGNVNQAQQKSQSPSPIEATNQILASSSLSIELSINDDGDIQAKHGDGPQFSISQLSDGERNAVMLAAQVLTSDPDTLFVVDEPERHLHRSITEPMLTALFEKRQDCAFVISTHEPELPNSKPDSQVLISRKCRWQGVSAVGWEVDVLDPEIEIPDDIKMSILGARRTILFIEGQTQSLDFPLLSSLFPGTSVVPMGSCVDVERSVIGLQGTEELHWLQPFGLIDRDDREDDNVQQLAERGIFALDVSSIESIFYSPVAIEALATKQAELYDIEKEQLLQDATAAAFEAVDENTVRTLAARRSEKSVRNRVLSHLPKWHDIKVSGDSSVNVVVDTTFPNEIGIIEDAIKNQNLEILTTRFCIKKTGIPSSIARALRFPDRYHFEDAVVTRAKRDENFRNSLREYLGPIAQALSH